MALFLTTPEFRKYKTIDANTKFATLEPVINEAEAEYIKPLLGTTLYDSLVSAYVAGAGTPTDPDLAALLPYVQRPLALYAYYHGFTDLMARVGDAGVRVARGEQSDSAPKWMHDQLKAKALRDADRHADLLLNFLEDNRAVAAYTGWASSPSNTIAEGMILHNADAANSYIDIQNSRRIFLKMKRFITAVEEKEIKKLICKEQYDKIVTGIKTENLTVDETYLVNLLRPIVAKQSLWLAIPMLAVKIDPDGLFMYSSSDPTVRKELASAEMISNYRKSLREGITGYEGDIQEAKQYILDNIDIYPLIKDSTCYTSRAVPGPKHQVDNDPLGKNFSV